MSVTVPRRKRVGLLNWAGVVSAFCYEEESFLVENAGYIDYWRYGASYDLVGHFVSKQFACLGRNLAIAGALTRSFNLGAECGRIGNRYGFTYGIKAPWWPNLSGRRAESPEGPGRSDER